VTILLTVILDEAKCLDLDRLNQRWKLADSELDSTYKTDQDKMDTILESARELLASVRRRKMGEDSYKHDKELVKAVKRSRVHKRHCWDVADICCMWNVCDRR